MKKLRIFKCGHCLSEYEIFASDKQINHKCKCGKMATKALSAPKFINNSCGKNASVR